MLDVEDMMQAIDKNDPKLYMNANMRAIILFRKYKLFNFNNIQLINYASK